MDRLTLSRRETADAQSALATEWLVTNGLGGFASGTVAQANTRRYHGLLVASLRPPVDRIVMLSKLDATVTYRGRRIALHSNEYADGTLAPQGFARLASFAIDGKTPTWTFAIDDALLQQSLWMAQGANTSYVSYTLRHASAPMDLELVPLCTYRDYHAHTQRPWAFALDAVANGCTVTAFAGARPLRLGIDQGAFAPDADWHWNFHHRAEAERGLDAQEHLWRPGVFRSQLQPGESCYVTATCETAAPAAPARALLDQRQRTKVLQQHLTAATPDWVRDLVLAADDFIATRSDAHGKLTGRTVLAGYPWFSDWGRDTMIALPGLTLATQRLDDAAAILRTFSQHVSDGMLPNRFPDDGEAAEYNTVDATLWYFHAIDAYLGARNDSSLLRDLYPILKDIIAWHQRGTRHGISVDRHDGLLRAGERGVQLTWMDAKVGDWVVTPRIGKPVEINALWHFALTRMAVWAKGLKDRGAAADFTAAALQAKQSFRARFWNDSRGYLNDVIDVPGQDMPDDSLRPNQIFAVSLGTELLAPVQARAVVDRCGRDLLTPVGLRSLAPDDPSYVPRYLGGPLERDGCYHQGTVWSWLLGPYALAHWRVYGDAMHALALLQASAAHLREACVGQVSEIFDAAAPHAPRGCFAQAWGVAESLRAWHLLDAAAKTTTRRIRHAE
jgi:predicted glycogen debranching enzyme